MFQSTHPRGVRRFVRSSQPCLILVSIHAPAWGATWRSGRWPRSTATVSIHAPAWGATCSRWLPGKKGQDCFNPRTRVGCDVFIEDVVVSAERVSIPIPRTSPPPSSGFNPRTRVGCDNQLREAFALQRFVSIHAPAWGATMEIPRYARVFDVSIHAPAWGATLQATLQKKSPRSFNPRTRVGCDPLRRGAGNYLTPCFNPRTRVGCDGHQCHQGRHRGLCFNPRTRVGCDRKGASREKSHCRFQSTHPRGVRRAPRVDAAGLQEVSIHAPAWGATPPKNSEATIEQFQSTHPRGVRPGFRERVQDAQGVSIHAPAWGATTAHVATDNPAVQVSIHAPAWGATGLYVLRIHRGNGFNPRTRVGCDLKAFCRAHGLCEFQSTHPRGVRQIFGNAVHLRGKVSIHAPAWGATAFSFSSFLQGEEFQSTHPRGVRLHQAFRHILVYMFQSTHPRGVRRRPGASALCRWSRFNPRTRVGCDLRKRRSMYGLAVFQSTHPRGVRPVR